MVQFIQRSPSFGEQLGQGLGQGLSKGVDFAQQMKLQEMKQKKEQESANFLEWENTFSQLRDLIPSTGKFPAFPWSDKAANREKFDVLAFQLERYARAAHTKGALSTKIYQSLLSKLPNANATEEQNRGRIEAWEDALLRKGAPEEKSRGKGKFNPNNPEHKAKASQLFKTFGDKEKVREKLRTEFEGI